VPGDLLVVPRDWWHAVEALAPSISVSVRVDRTSMREVAAEVRFLPFRAVSCRFVPFPAVSGGQGGASAWPGAEQPPRTRAVTAACVQRMSRGCPTLESNAVLCCAYLSSPAVLCCVGARRATQARALASALLDQQEA
jgi:hypothetical protein